MATKPTYKPELATDDINLPEAGTDNKIRPSEVTREVGYDFRQYLPAQEYNYQWFTVNQWINYFEEVTDDIGVTEVATKQEALDGDDNSKIMTPLRNRQFASQYGLGNTPAQATDIESPSLDSLTTSGEFSVVSATGGPTSLGGPVTGILTVSTRPFTSGGGDQTICHQQLVVDDVLFERFQDQAEFWTSWKTINHNIGGGLVEQGTGDSELALGTPGTISSSSSNEVSEESHTHDVDIASFFGKNTSGTKGYHQLTGKFYFIWGRETIGSGGSDRELGPFDFGLNVATVLNLQLTPAQTNGVSGNISLYVSDIFVAQDQFYIYADVDTSGTLEGFYWFAVALVE